jgi:hypothetical protein
MIPTNPRSRLQWIKGVVRQYGFRLVLGEIPRLFYGNDAGLRENFVARRELHRLQALALLDRGDVDPRGTFLRREGYVLLGRPYPADLVARLQSQFARLIVDPRTSLPIGPRVKDAIRGIVDPLERMPDLQHLLSDEVRRVLRTYYGTHFKVEHVRLWRNLHVPGPFAQQDVYSNLWHNDHDPVTLLRLFVYMSDSVTRETGGTRFHPIATTKTIIRRGYLRRRAILPPARRILEDESRVLCFEGDAGSACLLNPQLCLHRAGVPAPGTQRDMIQFTIAPADRPLSDRWAVELPPDPVMRAYAAASV